ncbi:MAG TPA: extracellular solute-binding protein [Candidatus Sulfotelmatobacter sp.]|nr:extracellular solute-binding protein [Candidatus Sulfotelmatobacter sp.]
MRTTRTRTAGLAALVPLVALIASACGSGTPTISVTPVSGWTPDATLLAAAQKEGTLNVIALPPDWCNYGPMIDAFKGATGLAVNSITPDAGSGDELTAITSNKTNAGPQAPDVIDVGYSFGAQAVQQGLLQAYKVSTWSTIDPKTVDPNGYWYGDYYGVLSFAVNTSVIKDVPTDWSDLLKPEYAHSVALAGDPTASNQAIQSVEASALGNGGSLDNAQKGLDFFKQLQQAGNFVPTVGGQGTLASGETPILITWNYLAQSYADALKGNPAVQVVIPKTGRFGGIYVQGISAYAPHPNAAKLWEEYLYSDAGQIGWLTGYCYTTRFADLVSRNAIPADLKAKLPDDTGVVFPTPDQLTASKTLITTNWKSEVGVSVATAAP